MTQREANEYIENNLVQITIIEPKMFKLLKDVPKYNQLNSEMIEFITKVFGNQGWLQLFQMKLFRR